MKPKSILMALWIPAFCAGCGQGDLNRVQAAGKVTGLARASQILPDLPDDCRRLSRSGVREGDRLDIALLKTDAALAQQNARTTRCVGWHDQLRAGSQQGG